MNKIDKLKLLFDFFLLFPMFSSSFQAHRWPRGSCDIITMYENENWWCSDVKKKMKNHIGLAVKHKTNVDNDKIGCTNHRHSRTFLCCRSADFIVFEMFSKSRKWRKLCKRRLSWMPVKTITPLSLCLLFSSHKIGSERTKQKGICFRCFFIDNNN